MIWNGLGTSKIKRTVPLSNSILESFTHPLYKNILGKALLLAKQHRDICNDNIRLIKNCRKSLQHSNNEAKKKKQTETCFDVTMGRFDGVEVCKLVGIYILCF